MPLITGTESADTLNAGPGADTIDGLGGDDTITWDRRTAGSDLDVIGGGSGNDLLTFLNLGSFPVAAPGVRTNDDYSVTVTATGSTDFAVDLTHVRTPELLFPNQTITTMTRVITGTDIERFSGGSLNDAFNFTRSTSNLTIDAGAGADSIVSGSGNDSLLGGEGNDTLSGGAGANTVDGGAGDDLLVYNGGVQQVFAGAAGVDTVSFASLADSQTIYPGFGGSATTSYVLTVFGAGADGFSAERVTTTISYSSILPVVTSTVLETLVSSGSGVERFIGGSGSERFLLSSFNNSVTIDGGAGDDSLVGGLGADSLVGGAGADTIDGGPGGQDTLDGGAGYDAVDFSTSLAGISVSLQNGSAISGGFSKTLLNFEQVNGSAFNDTISGGSGNDLLFGAAGADRIDGGRGADNLNGGAGADTLNGGRGNDVVSGNEGDDVIFSSTGRDAVYGGDGADVLVLSGTAASWSFGNLANGVTHAINRYTGTDIVISDIEGFRFGETGALLSKSQVQDATFLPTLYLASNVDLYNAFGLNTAAATAHYNQYGKTEARETGSFNALGYGASNTDLGRAFGSNREALAQHYLQYGQFEGRSLTAFDPLRYAASSRDLAIAFGSDGEAAVLHYLAYGLNEGRSTTAFDPYQYLASNLTLNATYGAGANGGTIDAAGLTEHYLNVGVTAGLSTNSFNAQLYAASNSDLARIYGTDSAAASFHYVRYGLAEGRPTATFDTKLYAASNTDLAQIIGNNASGSLSHYLTYGADEGRPVTGFDMVGYLLNNPSLAGSTPSQALDQYLNAGADAGLGVGAFGADQTAHGFTGSSVTDRADQDGDKDWFTVALSAGQTVTFNGSTLVGRLDLYDGLGRLIGSDADGRDFAVTVTTGGDYYLVATGAAGAIGVYGVTRSGAASSLPHEGDQLSAAAALANIKADDPYLTANLDQAGVDPAAGWAAEAASDLF